MKSGCVDRWTNKQTGNGHTDTLIAILCIPTEGKVITLCDSLIITNDYLFCLLYKLLQNRREGLKVTYSLLKQYDVSRLTLCRDKQSL